MGVSDWCRKAVGKILKSPFWRKKKDITFKWGLNPLQEELACIQQSFLVDRIMEDAFDCFESWLGRERYKMQLYRRRRGVWVQVLYLNDIIIS